ncbi:MAG: WXG100 family type VII secretion target [Mycobacteriaceae bacterium]|nr:WXG100 family type VII secretion target [Mycobacteriaceae bacterium]MBV9638445.1 WXG100 family type VII secretion target [Mycobacteriaceae bacterium]
MTNPQITYHFGDVHDHGALIKAQAANLQEVHQGILADLARSADFWGGTGSAGYQECVAEINKNFAVIYEQADQHGTKVQAAGADMGSTDGAVGNSWTFA